MRKETYNNIELEHEKKNDIIKGDGDKVIKIENNVSNKNHSNELPLKNNGNVIPSSKNNNDVKKENLVNGNRYQRQENKIRNFDEYYPSEEYARDASNQDYYAKKQTLDEFYNNVNGVEKYAVKRLKTGEELPFFARTKRGAPILAKKEGGSYYPTKDGKIVMPETTKTYVKMPDGSEVYPQNENNDQLYNTDGDGNQYLAKDENGIEYYAMKTINGEQVEYLPVDRHNNPIRIELSEGRAKYPINTIRGTPIYEKDAFGNELYWFDNHKNTEYYGKNEYGTEIYAKSKNGTELYALDKNKNEDIFAKNADGIPYYAKDEFQNEIYPRTYLN